MNNQLFHSFLIVVSISTFLCAVATAIVLPVLRKKKMGQRILEVGPAWHKAKEGTPTMGGIAFFLSLCILLVVFYIIPSLRGVMITQSGFLPTVLFALGNGAIGIFDDSVKLQKKQNQGLSAKSKFLLQLLLASLYLLWNYRMGYFETSLPLPFTDLRLPLGVFYFPFALLLLTGMVNSVNLTDGIDGLAAGVTMAVSGFFAVAAILSDSVATLLLAALTMGLCLGFLLFNAHPAKIFMGDTGSLFLGAMVVGMAFSLGSPLIILSVGIFYLIETASVILQVGYFKLTRKRLFLMAPFHHHLEKKGISEEKIVIFAIFLTIISSIFSIFGL